MPSILLAASEAPWSIPTWAWMVASAVVAFAVTKVLPLAAERYIQKQTKHPSNPPSPNYSAQMDLHEKADKERHETVVQMFNENRRQNAITQRTLVKMHGRMVRIETKLDPDAPAADLTGEYDAAE